MDTTPQEPTSAPTPQGEPRDVEITLTGALAHISLTRPKALNALNDAMRRDISEAIPRFTRDPNVYAMLTDSAFPRAFCAGGDIRELSTLAQHDIEQGRKSLADEYRMNWQIECFPKPTISLINGLCVGSGVGLTLYNTHRVAGENYSFAMPETGIGLFPDLGVCSVLAKLPDNIGTYLGLTGRAIGAADALALGFVTHCISAQQFPEIIDALRNVMPVDPLLDDRHEEREGAILEPLHGLIADTFSGGTMEEIIAALGKIAAGTGSSAVFCEKLLEDLSARSPTSLKVTLSHLKASATRGLSETLEIDHRIASRCLEGSDFHEGVRALIIDKDNSPVWKPAKLEDVTEENVLNYFKEWEGNDLKLPTRIEMQGNK